MLLHCRCWLVLLSLMLLRPCATAAVVDEKIHHFDSAPWKEQISIANEMLLEFHREGLTDELIQFSNKSHPDSVRMCVMYWAAEHYYAAQDYDEAVTLAEKALPLSRGADKANCMSLLSLAYFRQGSYEQAASYALKCYQLDKATGDPDLMKLSQHAGRHLYRCQSATGCRAIYSEGNRNGPASQQSCPNSCAAGHGVGNVSCPATR